MGPVQQDEEVADSDGGDENYQIGEYSNEKNNNHEIEESSKDEAGYIVVQAVFRFYYVGLPGSIKSVDNITASSYWNGYTWIFQHKDKLPSVSGERSMTSSWFKRKLANGEKVDRSWLLNSPFNEDAYCLCYLLFTSSSSNSRPSFELDCGFYKRRKHEKLQYHETSSSHHKVFITWRERERRIIDGAGTDAQIQALISLDKR